VSDQAVVGGQVEGDDTIKEFGGVDLVYKLFENNL